MGVLYENLRQAQAVVNACQSPAGSTFVPPLRAPVAEYRDFRRSLRRPGQGRQYVDTARPGFHILTFCGTINLILQILTLVE